jgi:hypothetical protein
MCTCIVVRYIVLDDHNISLDRRRAPLCGWMNLHNYVRMVYSYLTVVNTGKTVPTDLAQDTRFPIHALKGSSVAHADRYT